MRKKSRSIITSFIAFMLTYTLFTLGLPQWDSNMDSRRNIPGNNTITVAAVETRVTTANLNLRSGPGTAYAVILTIPKGAQVSVSGYSGTWAKVTYGGKQGYASTSYLTAPAATSPSTSSTKYTTSNLNFRTGPGTSYTIILTIPKGAAVNVISTSSGWAKITYGGRTGYVSSSYLTTTGTGTISPTPTTSSPPSVGTTTVRTTANLNFRTGPGTGYPIIMTIPKGSVVDLKSSSNGWSYLTYSGRTGYASSAYLSIETVSASAPAPAPPPPSTTPDPVPPPPTNTKADVKFIAHRGYSTIAPENTIPAYQLAKSKGFKYVETDLLWTSDGVPVLHHDYTIDRTSTGSGRVDSLTFAELRSYDFGSWKSQTYAGTKIASFQEFLEFCQQNNLHPYIEIRTTTDAQAAQLITMVRNMNMLDKVTWISFYIPSLQKILALHANARVGYLGSLNQSFLWDVKSTLNTPTNNVFVNVDYNSVTAALADMVYAAGMELEVWSVNNTTLIEQYIGMGITGITTDYIY